MRICFFSLNRLAFEGGAEKYILEVASELSKKEHEVFYLGDCRPLLVWNIFVGFVICPGAFKKLIKELIKLKRQPSFPEEAKKFLFPIVLRIAALLPFTKVRKETGKFFESCNLVLVKNELWDMIIFFLLPQRRKKTKTALLIFSSLFYPTITFRGKVHNFFYCSQFYRYLVGKYDDVIVSNGNDVDFLNKKFGISEEKIKYVPYGLDPKDFSVRFGRENRNIFRILFIGRLEEQKGIDFLVEIVKGLSFAKSFSNLKFTIIGDGPWRDQIISLTRQFANVEWLGVISRNEVKKAYLNHDLVLVPSRWETFSYVTLEAQFCGLPVIAFNIPGPQDIIEDVESGILVPCWEISDFVSAVKLYKGKGVTLDQKEYIRNRAIKKFSLEQVASALLSL